MTARRALHFNPPSHRRDRVGVNQRFPNVSATITWVLLLVFTVASYILGAGTVKPALMLAVLLLTLIKGQMIADYFMGLRHTRFVWRALMSAWLLTIGGTIAFVYHH